MATVAPVDVETPVSGVTRIVKWVDVHEGDTCTPVAFPDHTDKTMVVVGTFGGTSVSMTGSVDPAAGTMVALKDQSDNVIALTADGVETIVNAVYMYAPVLTGGAGTTVTIWLQGRRAQ